MPERFRDAIIAAMSRFHFIRQMLRFDAAGAAAICPFDYAPFDFIDDIDAAMIFAAADCLCRRCAEAVEKPDRGAGQYRFGCFLYVTPLRRY